MEHLGPAGALVVIEAEHMCMKMRGVRKSEPVMCTVSHRGVFSDDCKMRQEVLAMFGVARGEAAGEEWPVSDVDLVNATPRLRRVGGGAFDEEAC